MKARERILDRIRRASFGAGAIDPAEAASAARSFLPVVGPSTAGWIDLLGRKMTELHARFEIVDGPHTAAARLSEIARVERWRRVATHSGDLTDVVASNLDLPLLRTDRGYDRRELEGCDAALTECDALVAQTGSVLITARSAGGRALSVLPPHHVVLARREQILPDLPAAFELLERTYGGGWPSFVSFITGPSRTGDIERILVLGAHGPKKLTVFAL